MNKKAPAFAWLVCGLGALFYCYEYFLRVAPSVMTQELSQSFNISAAALGNLAAVYYYVYTPMQLPAGLLMDRFGPRRLLTIACLACVIGCFLFASGHFHLAVIGRFLIGFGSAFAFVGTMRLAVSWLPASRLAFMSGSITTLGMLGAMGSDIAISHLMNLMHWQKTVLLSALIGLVVAALIWFIVPKNPPANSNNFNSHSPLDFQQLFKQFLQLIKKKELWLIGLVGCFFYMPISVFAELWGIPYLKQAFALSNQTASMAISLVFFGNMVGGPITGWLADKLDNRTLPITLFAGITGILFMVLLYAPGLSKISIYALLFCIGVLCSGENLVFPIACRMTNVRLAGTAVATTNMLVMLGGLVFQPLLGVFLELASGKHVKGDLSVYTGSDFQHALMILPILLLLIVVLMFFIKDKKNYMHEPLTDAQEKTNEQINSRLQQRQSV